MTEQPHEEPAAADPAGTEPEAAAEVPGAASEPDGEPALGGWDEPAVPEETWLPIEVEGDEVIIEITDAIVVEEPADVPAEPDTSLPPESTRAVDTPQEADGPRMTGWRPFGDHSAGEGSPVPRRPSVLQRSGSGSSAPFLPRSFPPPPSFPPQTPGGSRPTAFPSREPAPAQPPRPGGPPAKLAETVAKVRGQLAALSSDRPEVVIGAAFVGGLILASILKRLAR